MKAFYLKRLLLSLAILASCSKEIPPPSCEDCRGTTADQSVESDERARQLSDEIEDMLANKTCASDDDCKLIGIGYTPCGQPAAFYTYSTQNVDDVLLEEKARQLRDLQKQGSPDDVAGVCGFKGPPPPACVKEDPFEEKRCMLPGDRIRYVQ